MKFKGIIILVAVAVAIVVYSAAYIVDETEQVVITQFGKIVGVCGNHVRHYWAGGQFDGESV